MLKNLTIRTILTLKYMRGSEVKFKRNFLNINLYHCYIYQERFENTYLEANYEEYLEGEGRGHFTE